MRDLIVVGGGASGLVVAIMAARRGKKVLLLEKNSKVGKKLLATGNGKCNIANQKPTINRFYSKNPSFIEQSLDGYSYQSVKQFFRSIGLELIEAKEGKVFPLSLQASSVVELLACECEQLSVRIVCDSEVQSLVKTNKGYEVIHSKGRVQTETLVIATGHLSAPQLGGVDKGVVFARKLGHRIVTPFPTLVQLTSAEKESYLKRMAGVKVESRVRLQTKNGIVEKQGDVLFTTYGISGLAILDISRFVMEELVSHKTVSLELDFMPKMSKEQLLSLMKKSLRKKSSKPLEIWMQGFINKKLILPILEPLNLSELLESELRLEHIEKIVEAIKSFNFVVDGSRGYKGAEVATGGVDTRDVNPLSMESKKHKNLYFTGEVLDVDADRGGFNLHFAWISAFRAGASV